jgi:hypothetical protein
MPDVNIKLISPVDTINYAEKRKTYLLDVKVLENLKQAIKQARDVNVQVRKMDRG